MLAQLRRVLAPLHRRVMFLVMRGAVINSDEKPHLERLQLRVRTPEIVDGAERVGAYGFASNPHPGATAVVLCVGGSKDHPIVVATEDSRYRPRDLKPGEVCIYTDEGDEIRFKRDRQIVVKTGGSVRIEGPLHVTGPITCGGNVSDQTGSMAAMRTIYNGHTHGSGPTPNQPMT